MYAINSVNRELIINNLSSSAREAFDCRQPDQKEAIIQEIFNRATEELAEDSPNFQGVLTAKALHTRIAKESRIPRTDNRTLKPLEDLIFGNEEWVEALFGLEKVESLLHAVTWDKDAEIFKQVRQWFADRIANATTEIPDAEIRQVYLRNLLALYPYFSPEEDELLSLPFGPSGALIDYQVKALQLTPDFMGSPLVAYGLTSQDPQAAPILLFKGTTYPSDEGFFLSLLTDINPFMPVGGFAFHLTAKSRIEAWLKENTTEERKAMVAGVSLGGALSLQTACYFPQYLSHVFAFNSPAMTSSEISSWEANIKALGDAAPRVEVYLQDKDPISRMVGCLFAQEWKLHHVYAPLDWTPIKSSFQSHSGALTAHPQVFIVPGSATGENNRIERLYIWPIFQNILFVLLFAILFCVYVVYFIAYNIYRIAAEVFKTKA
jgi:pimeloyl-ACP methyl ester carboxylesterase